MKTLIGVYFISQSFLKDELTLSSGGTKEIILSTEKIKTNNNFYG